MTFDQYINHSDCQDDKKIAGFTIGKGKKVYWYFLPTRSGYYRVFPVDQRGQIGWARRIVSETEIHVVYKYRGVNKMSDFEKDLAILINRYSLENGSNTPDFVLAKYLIDCLKAFDQAVNSREKWFGRKNKPGNPEGR